MLNDGEPDEVPNLDAIDQEIRINELEEQAKSMGGIDQYAGDEADFSAQY